MRTSELRQRLIKEKLDWLRAGDLRPGRNAKLPTEKREPFWVARGIQVALDTMEQMTKEDRQRNMQTDRNYFLPLESHLYVRRGLMYVKLGDRKKAIKALSKAIEAIEGAKK